MCNSTCRRAERCHMCADQAGAGDVAVAICWRPPRYKIRARPCRQISRRRPPALHPISGKQHAVLCSCCWRRIRRTTTAVSGAQKQMQRRSSTARRRRRENARTRRRSSRYRQAGEAGQARRWKCHDARATAPTRRARRGSMTSTFQKHAQAPSPWRRRRWKVDRRRAGGRARQVVVAAARQFLFLEKREARRPRRGYTGGAVGRAAGG